MAIAAMLLSSAGAWAAGTVTVATLLEGTVNTDVGDVAYEVSEGVCTLTVTPAAGYCISAENIIVLKTIDSEYAQARSQAPAYGDTIDVVAVDPKADPRGVTAYTFKMPSEEFDVEVQADFQVFFMKYDIWIGNVQVTERNQFNVLGEAVPSIAFDGKNTLTIRNYQSTRSIKCGIDSLRIVLFDENIIDCSESADTPIVARKDIPAPVLVFASTAESPGLLKLVNEDGIFISGFREILMENYLVTDTIADDTLLVSYKVPITPVLSDDPENPGVPETTIEFQSISFTDGAGNTVDLSNTEIKNVLYTLSDHAGDFEEGNQETGEPDGIILRHSLNDEEVENATEMYPGSDEYADMFKGITIMVPAGQGFITIVCKTFEDAVLKVKIGDTEPMVFTNLNYDEPLVIPYACPRATYVYIYHGGTEGAATRQVPFREKVETATVKITTVGATASSLIDVPTIEDLSLIGDGGNSVKVFQIQLNNYTSDRHGLEFGSICGYPITEFMEGLFDGVENKDSIAFIDLSQTGIRGINCTNLPSRLLVKKKASRLGGMLDGFEEHTLIFLPEGNEDGGENNIIINGNCRKLRLLESGLFMSPYDFTAEEVELDRKFTVGQPATVFMPFELSNVQTEMLGTFHSFRNIKDDKAIFNDSESDNIKANTPYLFVPDVENISMTDVVVITNDNKHDLIFGDGLVGTFDPIDWKEDATTTFVLQPLTDEGDGCIGHFLPVKAGTKTLNTHAYFVTSHPYDLLRVFIDKIDVTSVSSVREVVKVDNSPIYDLSGRAVSGRNLTKGIYVYKGRKYIVQ